MAEYVERDVALKEIFSVYEREFPTASGAFDEFVTKTIPNILTYISSADVAPVRRGQWKPAGLTFMGESVDCPECGYRIAASIGRGWNYCPNCGAKMEVEHDD